MTVLVALAILSLFTALKAKLGPVQVRPFDGLVALMFLVTLFTANLQMPKRVLAGLLILMPYFLWHVASATTLGASNGLREALQIATVTVFALILAIHVDRLDYARLGRLLLIGMLLITAYNIGWHLDAGYWSGWKRLLDPKRIFTFLPVVVGCMILFAHRRERRRKLWVLWFLVGVVILFSGERKAILVYVILWAALAARGRVLAAIPLVAGGLVLLFVFGAVTENEYLSRQVRSIFDPMNSVLSAEEIATGAYPESQSNTQRLYALRLTAQMVSRAPLLGVGTNGFSDFIKEEFQDLPEFLRASAHGEFLRVLAENGLIGLLFYLLIWKSAFQRLRRRLKALTREGLITPSQSSVALFLLLVPALIYVMMEASGTHSFVVLLGISLMPEFCDRALRWRAFGLAQAAAPEHRLQPRPVASHGGHLFGAGPLRG